MKYVYILLIFLLQSCERKESKYIFEQNPISNLYEVKIKDVVAHEKQLHAFERKNATVDYKLAMAFKYPMETLNRKIFNRKDSNLYLETDYYYDKKDSTLKFVTYTWHIQAFSKLNSNKQKAKTKVEYNTIKEKYSNLKRSFSKQLKTNPKNLRYKDVTLWETKKANVFITIIDEETDNPGIYLFIKTKKNGL